MYNTLPKLLEGWQNLQQNQSIQRFSYMNAFQYLKPLVREFYVTKINQNQKKKKTEKTTLWNICKK